MFFFFFDFLRLLWCSYRLHAQRGSWQLRMATNTQPDLTEFYKHCNVMISLQIVEVRSNNFEHSRVFKKVKVFLSSKAKVIPSEGFLNVFWNWGQDKPLKSIVLDMLDQVQYLFYISARFVRPLIHCNPKCHDGKGGLVAFLSETCGNVFCCCCCRCCCSCCCCCCRWNSYDCLLTSGLEFIVHFEESHRHLLVKQMPGSRIKGWGSTQTLSKNWSPKQPEKTGTKGLLFCLSSMQFMSCRPKILLMEWWRVVVAYSWVQHGAAPVASYRGQSRHAAREGSKTLCTKASRMNSLRTMLGPLQCLGGWENRWPAGPVKNRSNPVWGPFGWSSEIPFQGLSSSCFIIKFLNAKNHKTIRASSYQSLSLSRTNRSEDSGFLPKIASHCVGSAQFICNEGAVPIFADSHQRHNPCGFVCGRLVLV